MLLLAYQVRKWSVSHEWTLRHASAGPRLMPDQIAGVRLIVLLTSFNRRQKTLDCLRCLEAAANHVGTRPEAVLIDDGSTDGTSDAVQARFPWVKLVKVEGNLFWNRGMHRAMLEGLGLGGPPAHFLWLNDDTNLEPDGLQRLFATLQWAQSNLGRPAIVVGATCDPLTRQLSYGGINALSRLRKFQFRKVHHPDQALPCQAMNGNVVLLPPEVVSDVGLLDPAFEHAMGDIDYGLRASRRGHPVLVAPGFVGTCSNNPVRGTYDDPSLGLRHRWRLMLHRKGLPWRSWLVLTRRHGGWAWPAYFAWPYLRVAMQALLHRRKAS